MRVTAFIFARGGSKGLQGKNIRSFGGKPLIAWSIEQASSVSRVDRVIVSTDSEEIAEVARRFGAQTPFIRPAELAGDQSPEWFSWRHALSHLRDTEGSMSDVMLSLPATAPLRKAIDIENCLDEYEKGDADVVITVTEAHRSPYFNMVRMDPDGSVRLVIPPAASITRRQDAPVIYDMATVAYVIRPEFVFSADGIFEGRVRAVQVPKERAIDIDTLFDFRIAEHLLALDRA
jgi:N-acylneuraminate cytidylyltransferase